MCMRHTGTPAPATTSAMRGSTRIADTSFTNDAPAAMAASATTAFVVSIEIGTSVASRRPRITARTRASSTSAGHRVRPRPGRLAADVEHVGALGDERDAAGDRCPGIEVLAAVRERVGRHVDHAHDRRRREPVRQWGHGRHPRMAPSTTRRRGALPFHTSHTEVEADLLRQALGPGASVLEAGCGRTTRLARFRDRIDRLAGVDLDESGGRMNESLDEFAVADLCGTLPFPDGTFDLVYSNFVVEHLERPPAAFAEWHRVLRPGGSVVVVTSNRSNPLMAAARVLPQGLRTAIKGRGPGRRGP